MRRRGYSALRRICRLPGRHGRKGNRVREEKARRCDADHGRIFEAAVSHRRAQGRSPRQHGLRGGRAFVQGRIRVLDGPGKAAFSARCGRGEEAVHLSFRRRQQRHFHRDAATGRRRGREFLRRAVWTRHLERRRADLCQAGTQRFSGLARRSRREEYRKREPRLARRQAVVRVLRRGVRRRAGVTVNPEHMKETSKHEPAPRAPSGTMSRTFEVKTERHTQLKKITAEVEQLVAESGCKSGVCYVYVPHTTAGLIINEGDDPDVARDIETTLDRIVPHMANYRHAEGNADSHIKTTLTATTATIFIEDGELALGRWQGIFFCEFDGPRRREVRVKIVPDAANE